MLCSALWSVTDCMPERDTHTGFPSLGYKCARRPPGRVPGPCLPSSVHLPCSHHSASWPFLTAGSGQGLACYPPSLLFVWSLPLPVKASFPGSFQSRHMPALHPSHLMAASRASGSGRVPPLACTSAQGLGAWPSDMLAEEADPQAGCFSCTAHPGPGPRPLGGLP